MTNLELQVLRSINVQFLQAIENYDNALRDVLTNLRALSTEIQDGEAFKGQPCMQAHEEWNKIRRCKNQFASMYNSLREDGYLKFIKWAEQNRA